MSNPARRAYSKRNRPIRACSECTRRKQKCDRSEPCRACIVRGAQDHCSYESLPRSSTPTIHSVKRLKTAACVPDSLSTATDGSPEMEDDGNEYNERELLRLGYTDKGDHALSALSELLQDTQKESRPLGTQVSALPQGMESDYWAIVDALPAEPLVQVLVQVFFDEVNWYFAVLDQYFFDVLFVEWTSISRGTENIRRLAPTVIYFPALLFQVLALALQFLPPNHSNELSLRGRSQQDIEILSGRLSEQGEKLMRLLGRRAPNVTSVQADVMCCAWQKNDGRGADSWHSLSNATRQAQEIGLHLNSDQDTDMQSTSPETLKRLWFDEHKRRLWATLLTWESHMSLQLGRPRLIHLSDCTCLDPIDCDFPVTPSQTLLRPARPDERPSLYTTQLVKYKIGQTIHHMMSMGATNPLLQNYDLLESLHSVVLELLNSLPQAMKLENPDISWDARLPGLVKQRLQIAIVVHSFLLALHRPHASKFETSRQRATQAAIGSLEASDKLFQLSEPHQYKIHTIVFHTIDSGIFLATAGIKYYTQESHTRVIIDQTLERAIERLKILKSRNSIARHGEKALAKCVRKFRQAWSDQVVSSMSFAPESPTSTQPSLIGSETRRYGMGEMTGPLSGSSGTDIEQDLLLSRDLFEDITNSRVSTSSWLEHMDMMSKLDLRFDESDFSWNDFFT